jgi:hypothetical protein
MGSHHQHQAFFLVFGMLLAASIRTSQDWHYCTSNLWQTHKVLYCSREYHLHLCNLVTHETYFSKVLECKA